MKNKVLFTLGLLMATLSLHAQYGLNSIGMGAVEYVEIDTGSPTLDVADGFTFEAWILNFGSTSNQKIAGKLAADFRNGFIFGIENLTVNFEVFGANGANDNLIGGNISDIGWTHVAGTYEIGGMQNIYINGQKVATSLSNHTTIDPNTNPFRLGIAPWDINALGFVGYIDEARYWQTAIDEAVIKDWMHRDVTEDHPNYDVLSFYHKYNETEGIAAEDQTANENWGVLSSSEMLWENQFLPFAGDGGLFDNGVQGVWNAKLNGASDIFSVAVTLFDTAMLENSVLLSHSDGDYSFVIETSGDFDRSLSRIWKVATQGGMFVNLDFDLSPIDMSPVNEVALLVSDDEDFSDAEIISGDLDGNTFSVEDYIFTDGAYYTLGFMTNLSSTYDANMDLLDIIIAPNPNNGVFQLQIDQIEARALQLRLLGVSGNEIWHRSLQPSKIINELISLDQLDAGVYWLEVQGIHGKDIRKLVIY